MAGVFATRYPSSLRDSTMTSHLVVARPSKIPNVLEEKNRVTLLNDLADVEVERAPHLVQRIPAWAPDLEKG